MAPANRNRFHTLLAHRHRVRLGSELTVAVEKFVRSAQEVVARRPINPLWDNHRSAGVAEG
jgi:hypothetical protein